jgi:virginiamycin B lyase
MLFTGIGAAFADLSMKEFQLPSGSRPHDVAPARDGGVWYTAQKRGALGRLDPATGKVEQIPLGQGSAPHGVIVGLSRAFDAQVMRERSFGFSSVSGCREHTLA